MDIGTITDLTALKALAYDQIAMKEQAERNLAAINQQITAVLAAPQEDAPSDDAAAKRPPRPRRAKK